MARKRRKKQTKKNSSERVRQAFGVLLVLMSLLILIALVSNSSFDDRRITGEEDAHLNPLEIQYRNQAGWIGALLSLFFMRLFGWLSFFVPAGLVIMAVRRFVPDRASKLRFNVFLLFVISLLVTMTWNIHLFLQRTLINEPSGGGGYIGEKLTALTIGIVGGLGSYVLLIGAILILLILYTSITPMLSLSIRLPGSNLLKPSYDRLRKGIGGLLSHDGDNDEYEEEDEDEYEADENEIEVNETVESDVVPVVKKPRPQAATKVRVKPAKPVQISSFDYKYPPVDILTESDGQAADVTAEELSFTARMLKETLETFGVRIEGDISSYPGPVITRYEFKPATGVKVNQILNLSDDLALALKARRIRIIAPIPGKAAVGVEIPNRAAQTVYVRSVIESDVFTDEKIKLPLALGKTTAGEPCVIDLAKLPHLLIAGATGSGKSVCINIVLTSLMYRMHPYQVRFILVDPKMLELTVYKDIPHLGRPVVTNPKRAEKVLADAVVEMEARYRKLANASVRNIEDFNRKQKEAEDKLPYIVVIVDELADLMMTGGGSSKTELLITRLAQMARAVGIHLILATQRPSVDVITGLIKANFPARIAFQVSSKVDSRTIIDANGAEKLLGNGDMLFLAPGQPEPSRIHGAYVTSEETDAMVSFIKEQGLPMLALENISQATGETTEAEIDMGDPLFREACQVVVRHKQGSVSLLQRRLGIGYQRAARLIDKLEKASIVSPFEGSKAREVLVDQAYIDTIFAATAAAPPAETQEAN